MVLSSLEIHNMVIDEIIGFVDGPFLVWLNTSHKLLKIHTLVEDTVIPCICSLLPKKSTITYFSDFDMLYKIVLSETPSIGVLKINV